MAFSPPEYCRLFAQKKAYQRGVTGTPAPPPPSYAPGEWTEAASGMVFVQALTLSGYGVNTSLPHSRF